MSFFQETLPPGSAPLMRFEHEWAFQKDDTHLLAGLVGALAVVAVGAAVLWPEGAALAVLVVLFAGLAGLLLNLHRLRQREHRHYLEHVQALHFLHHALPLRAPLPPLTGWAASPQLAGALVALIRQEEPEAVLELGSGASTVAMAYALEKAGRGHLLSLDHDERYAQRTARLLAEHGLEDWATVHHTPLAEQSVDGTVQPWYDLEAAAEPLARQGAIDLLVVDGPPHETAPEARRPAATRLHDYLSDRAVVVLDDALREDERAAARRWHAALGDLDASVRETAKGIAVMKRR